MGNLRGKIVVPLVVSDHNSEQDQVDRGLVDELEQRIGAILQEEKFRDIAPFGVDVEL